MGESIASAPDLERGRGNKSTGCLHGKGLGEVHMEQWVGPGSAPESHRGWVSFHAMQADDTGVEEWGEGCEPGEGSCSRIRH